MSEKRVTLVVVAVCGVGNSRRDLRVRVENYSNFVAFTCGFFKISDGRGVARSTCLAFARATIVLEISTAGPTTILEISTISHGKCEIESDTNCDYVQPRIRKAKRHRCHFFRLPVRNPNSVVRHPVRHCSRTNHQFINWR